MNQHCRKALAVLSAVIVTAASLTLEARQNPQNLTYAKTLKEIEQEKQEKQAQIEEKKKELEKLSADIGSQEAYQQTLTDEIKLINGKMLLIDSQMTNLIGEISAKEAEIADLQMQIDEETVAVEEGLKTFKARIRTLYVHGNDSLLSALVGATSFYDVLAKMDLIKRISKHDEEMIETLRTQIQTLTNHQQDLTASIQALNLHQTEIEALQNEFQASKSELDVALADSNTKMNTLTEKQKYTFIELEKKNQELEVIDQEQQDIIAEAIRKAMEEEKKQKEEEARKKAELEAKRTTVTTTVTTKATTKTTTTTTTTAKPIPQTTAAPVVTEAPAVQPDAANEPVVTTAATTAAPVVTEPVTEATPAPTTAPATTAAPVTTTTTQAPPKGSMFAWPCPGHYGISSKFGYRADPFGSGQTKGHSGIDIIGNVTAINGASACAAGNGKVIKVVTGWGGGYGNHVVIYHGNGYTTLYAHMQSVSVYEGQEVTVGQEVGKVGSTGSSTGPHLHFEVRINDTPVDPLPYLP